MKTKYIILFLTVIWFGCGKKNNDTISFPEKKGKLEDYFIKKKVFQIDYALEDSSKRLYGADKIAEFQNKYLVLDIYGVKLAIINKEGKVEKIIASKGEGPGEFFLISDFTIDKNKNIFVLDKKLNKVGKFDSTGNFINFFHIPFCFKILTGLENIKENKFIISAINDLTVDSKDFTDFKFLDYKDYTYLHLFDNSFNREKDFIHPPYELLNTMGAFSKGVNNLTPFIILEDNIITITQEGFYRLIEIDLNIGKEKLITVCSKYFKPLDLDLIKNFKINNGMPNFNLEKRGAIIASHTTPYRIMRTNKHLIIMMIKPYDNYFQEYNNNEMKYYFDLFSLSNGKIFPLLDGINTELELLGSNKNDKFFLGKFENSNNKLFFELYILQAK